MFDGTESPVPAKLLAGHGHLAGGDFGSCRLRRLDCRAMVDSGPDRGSTSFGRCRNVVLEYAMRKVSGTEATVVPILDQGLRDLKQSVLWWRLRV